VAGSSALAWQRVTHDGRSALMSRLAAPMFLAFEFGAMLRPFGG